MMMLIDSISPSFYNPIVLYFLPSNYASSYNYLLYIYAFSNRLQVSASRNYGCVIYYYIPIANPGLAYHLSLVAQWCLTLCHPMDCSPSGSSRQEYWSGLPSPPPGDLPNPGIEPRSPTLQVDSLPSEPPVKPKCRL